MIKIFQAIDFLFAPRVLIKQVKEQDEKRQKERREREGGGKRAGALYQTKCITIMAFTLGIIDSIHVRG